MMTQQAQSQQKSRDDVLAFHIRAREQQSQQELTYNLEKGWKEGEVGIKRRVLVQRETPATTLWTTRVKSDSDRLKDGGQKVTD